MAYAHWQTRSFLRTFSLGDKMKKIVNGVSIYYEMVGQGKPVILCHGNGEDHTIFDVLANRLKDHYQVILVDSRNHGQSERTDSYHYEVMAEDVKQLIDELHLEKPYFLGFSDGGIIGLIIAVKYPETCAKMMVLGANVHPKGVKKIYQIEMKEAYKISKDPLLKMMIEEPHISWKQLHQITIPIMVVAGEYDDMTYKHTKAIAHHIKESELVILDKKNHYEYVIHSDDLYPLCVSYFK